MTARITRSEAWVTLLGAAEPGAHLIEDALRRAPYLVAADGAASYALAAGHVPDQVIGDLDSLSDAARAAVPHNRITHVPEQDTPDFEKCLGRIDAPLVLATGFTGGRLDHTLAVLSTLVRQTHAPCLIFDETDVIFAAPPKLRIELEPGTRVSLFPMTRVTGRSEGLFWPIAGLDFAPDGQIGTSNQATGPIELTFYMPGMVVIVPRSALDLVLAALRPPD